MAVTRGFSGLLDSASLFLLVVLLGSFQITDYRASTTLDKHTSRNVTTRTLQSPVPPFWFSHVLQSRLLRGRRAFLRSRVPYDVDGARLFHLINLPSDIHPNPGPLQQRIKYPCRECNRNVRSNQDAILCSECDCWFHHGRLELMSVDPDKKPTVNSVLSYERNRWKFEHVTRNSMGNKIWSIYKINATYSYPVCQ